MKGKAMEDRVIIQGAKYGTQEEILNLKESL
jgi:hypothetical protein